MPSFRERLQHGWNAFINNRDPTYTYNYGVSSYYRPDRVRLTRGNERSIVTSLYNRIAVDVAAIQIRHVTADENGNFKSDVKSYLNECLTTEANIDQTGRAFIQDLVMTMCDVGHAAVVPVDTTLNPEVTGGYDVQTMRIGKVVQWYPQHVQVDVYNERIGKHEQVYLPKKVVPIIENPLFAVMNEPNSNLQRLIRKLNILDAIDEQSSSGKLDLIIQLPYVIKTDARRQQAEQRRKLIEDQLNGSKYGIAYTDGTERITQLNRAVDNNLMSQIEYLTKMLYGQLGMTEEIFNGTANEETMLNYYNRTIEPMISAITLEMRRKFLTKTARTQGQTIMFFNNPFKLTPVSKLADIADKFTRNEILSSNELRGIIGYKPVDDPRADELRNKNLNQSVDQMAPVTVGDEEGLDLEPGEEELEEDDNPFNVPVSQLT
jgi:hypothetical protein